jgi:hypothetical protein
VKIKRRKKKEPRNIVVMDMILNPKDCKITNRNSKRLNNPRKKFWDFED